MIILIFLVFCFELLCQYYLKNFFFYHCSIHHFLLLNHILQINLGLLLKTWLILYMVIVSLRDETCIYLYTFPILPQYSCLFLISFHKYPFYVVITFLPLTNSQFLIKKSMY